MYTCFESTTITQLLPVSTKCLICIESTGLPHATYIHPPSTRQSVFSHCLFCVWVYKRSACVMSSNKYTDHKFCNQTGQAAVNRIQVIFLSPPKQSSTEYWTSVHKEVQFMAKYLWPKRDKSEGPNAVWQQVFAKLPITFKHLKCMYSKVYTICVYCYQYQCVWALQPKDYAAGIA